MSKVLVDEVAELITDVLEKHLYILMESVDIGKFMTTQDPTVSEVDVPYSIDVAIGRLRVIQQHYRAIEQAFQFTMKEGKDNE